MPANSAQKPVCMAVWVNPPATSRATLSDPETQVKSPGRSPWCPNTPSNTHTHTQLACHETPCGAETNHADSMQGNAQDDDACVHFHACGDTFVSLHCLLHHMSLIAHHLCLYVCVFQRGAQRTGTNNISSASINLLLPPTGGGVAGVKRRKQECQESKRSVFAPGGWWVCEEKKGDHKNVVLFLARCK